MVFLMQSKVRLPRRQFRQAPESTGDELPAWRALYGASDGTSWCFAGNEGMDPCSNPYSIPIVLAVIHSLILY